MGYYAINPETNTKIHVKDWEVKYPGLDATCDVCNTDMYIRAEVLVQKDDK
ncbi:hypothetical protein [Bacillus mycoides]|uniref:hypothetical protein n=1 Tax=Bacillus mycoides TaxID=1405 RepID=UPI0013F5D8F2|nr:hypothetical protein [Bacillus mycoides]